MKNTQSFATPRKHKQSNPEITETTTTTAPVQADVYYLIKKMSYSTPTTSLKLPPSRKIVSLFYSDGKSAHAAQ